MILNSNENKRFKSLAQSAKASFLLEYLEKVKDEVADVRTTLKVKPDFEREVRIALCDVIDELLIEPLKRQSTEITPPEDDYR